jgi:hypothetical protein
MLAQAYNVKSGGARFVVFVVSLSLAKRMQGQYLKVSRFLLIPLLTTRNLSHTLRDAK